MVGPNGLQEITAPEFSGNQETVIGFSVDQALEIAENGKSSFALSPRDVNPIPKCLNPRRKRHLKR